MRNILTCLVFLISGLAFAQELPTLRYSKIETSYIPNGFDSNDNVQMVVEGVYRDTCSRPAGTQFKVNAASKTIEILSYEYRYEGPCLDVLVPHNEVVNVGVVPDGNYRVMQSNGADLGRLNIVRATKSSPDDYLYAPVSNAQLTSRNGKVVITVSGAFTNSCMKLAQVVPHVQPKVISVQPIAEIDHRVGNCINGNFPFESSVVISNVRAGRYLLHVRSLNGNAVNNLFDIN